MSCQKTTKEVVSSRIVRAFAARPWLLVLLLMVTVSVVSGSLAVEGGDLVLEPGVMGDGDTDPGPGPDS